MTVTKVPKKLIEVALPLDDINSACAYEKMPGIGAHPRGIHLWWARRPLAAARAVIFAQMVNDPGYERGLGRGINKEKAHVERERLFEILRKLVLWENINNESILCEARAEIVRSWRETCELNRSHPQAKELFNPDKLPAFHDPFAGGGAIPLEAQRLGLESYASDLNPVSVLINKGMIEIPPRFTGRGPIGPIPTNEKQAKIAQDWPGPKGLAEDVRRYGARLWEQARKQIGHLYPQVDLPKKYGGGKATVIAWLWARTVKSPLSDVLLFLIEKSSGRTETQLAEAKFGDSCYQQCVNGDCRLLESKGLVERRGTGGPNDPYKYHSRAAGLGEVEQ